jgi:hypothetical protein
MSGANLSSNGATYFGICRLRSELYRHAFGGIGGAVAADRCRPVTPKFGTDVFPAWVNSEIRVAEYSMGDVGFGLPDSGSNG